MAINDESRLTIDEIAADINKKMGIDVLIKASDVNTDVPRLSSGILSFDLALGGGWAANQWNEIVGEESSGKTAIAYRTVAANQERDPKFMTLWLAAEEFVPSYAASFGVDTERLWVIETNAMEAGLSMVIKAIENHTVDLVVIDSIPALVTETEVKKDLNEMSIGTGAKVLSTFFKKSAKAQRRSLTESDRSCTLIAINQWRDSIGVMFGDPRTTPGGKAKNYFYFTRMEVRRDEWLTEGSSIEDRVGQSIKTRVFKNKTYRPQQVAVVDYYFADTAGFKAGEFDTVKDIVNVCLALDVFEGRYKFEGERIAGKKEDLYTAVRADIALRDKLSDVARRAVLPHLYSEGGL